MVLDTKYVPFSYAYSSSVRHGSSGQIAPKFCGLTKLMVFDNA